MHSWVPRPLCVAMLTNSRAHGFPGCSTTAPLPYFSKTVFLLEDNCFAADAAR